MPAEQKAARDRAEAALEEGNTPPSGPPLGDGKGVKAVQGGHAAFRRSITRGPLIVVIIAYGVFSLWDFLCNFTYLDDPNALVKATVVTALVFHGASVLMTGLGLLAFRKTEIVLMGIYVWSLTSLQLLGMASFVLSLFAPLPLNLKNMLDHHIAEVGASGLPTKDVPTESEYKTHRTLLGVTESHSFLFVLFSLFSTSGPVATMETHFVFLPTPIFRLSLLSQLVFRAVFVILVWRYYLGARKHDAKQRGLALASAPPTG